MKYVDKDSLGTAIWIFWMGIVAVILTASVLFQLNSLAVMAERGKPNREASYAVKAGETVEPTQSKVTYAKSVTAEAAERTWTMCGKGLVTILIIVSFNLWLQKRPYKVVDDKFVDKVTAGRNVK